jgi:RNA ligase
MHYTFPSITHISQVLAAINGKDEFIVKHDEVLGYKVVNYIVNFAETFPPVVDERTAILRECRGLVFDAGNGEIISRPLHKFFNFGEKSSEVPDFSRPHRILQKLDGSFIRPIRTKTGPMAGKLMFGTKMGVTEVAQKIQPFIEKNKQYVDFCHWCCDEGKTPTFEFTSPSQQIVIHYQIDMLTMLAIRDNITGEYIPY